MIWIVVPAFGEDGWAPIVVWTLLKLEAARSRCGPIYVPEPVLTSQRKPPHLGSYRNMQGLRRSHGAVRAHESGIAHSNIGVDVHRDLQMNVEFSGVTC